MHIISLSLLQFKNYRQAQIRFVPGINCFTGNNGTGKTNILDAIYYLSFCKSFSNPADTQNILFNEEFFLIQGQYQVNGNTDELYCGVKRGQKKVFKRNKKEYERLSDHIGSYPLVLIYPGDVNLILGGSEERRKFVDGVISQYDREYLHRLIDYNKALMQRNSLLKIFAEKRYFDESSLEIWDEQLINHGTYINQVREEFFRDFREVFRANHAQLSANAEETDILYESALTDQPFDVLLKESRKKDLAIQYTSTGIHKDNLLFELHGQPLKKFGSQGQQKTYVIALKLAQYQFIREVKKLRPILLFDDIFDKLDPTRVELLLKLVSGEEFGQVFITDTHTERLESIMNNIHAHCRLFDIDKGEVIAYRDLGKTSETKHRS
ncbi:MAG: DNA replication/repair protein RecF [Bacteroidota bacterium]